MEEQDTQKVKEQLEELSKLVIQAKNEITTSEATVKSLQQIVTSIQTYNEKFEEIRKTIEDPESGIVANLELAKKAKTETESLRQDSETQLNTIKSTLVSVETNVTEMNAAYLKFTEINSSISNPESGLSAILKKSGIVKEEIDKLKQDSDAQLTAIKTTLITVQARITEMSKVYDEFLVLKTKLDDPENGIANIHDASTQLKDEIVALKAQSDTLFQEIKKFRDEAHNYTKEIEEFKRLSKEGSETIGGYEAESKNFKDRIEKIYKIATDTGLANSFDERRRDLVSVTNRWFLALMASTAILTGSIIFIFLPVLSKETMTIDAYVWYRLTLTSPLIFLIGFASVQYGKERSLLEKYAFKAATAVALEGYTTLLINTFGQTKDNNEKEILSFVLRSMSSIYREPHEGVKESKFSFGLETKIATLKTDFTEKIDETKKELEEIKELLVNKGSPHPVK